MTETLDFAVARLVFGARVMERALHDPGPWTISWGPFSAPAERVVSDVEVVFRAEFEDQCYLLRPEPTATLRCAGEVVGVREVEFPGDQPFVVEWALSLAALQPA